MKILGLVAAASTMVWAMPASAAVLIFQIVGYVPVTSVTSYGPTSPAWPSECDGLAFCPDKVTHDLVYVAWSDISAVTTDNITYIFDEYRPGPRAGISGSFQYLGNGSYEGLSLIYNGNSAFTSYPFTYSTGETSTFSVYQKIPTPVPEPLTWILMILGFGGVSFALRHRRSVSFPSMAMASQGHS